MDPDLELLKLRVQKETLEKKALLRCKHHIELRQNIRKLCDDLTEKAEKSNDVQMLMKIRELVLVDMPR